ENRARAHQPCDQVAEIAGRRTNNREVRTFGLGLHRRQFRRSRRDESIEVAREIGMKKLLKHQNTCPRLKCIRQRRSWGSPSTRRSRSGVRLYAASTRTST